MEKIRYNPEKPLQVGGQAVIEGVMMRAPGRIATAVRRAAGDIVVQCREYRSLPERFRPLRWPILRGAVGLVEMMYVGIDTLNFSAEVAMQDIEARERANGTGTAKNKAKKPGQGSSKLKIGLTVALSLTVGIGIFFLTPLIVTTLLFDVTQDALTFNVVAGLIRIMMLMGYLGAISMMKEVKKLFRYHGAEHKAVFTFESGGELVPDVAAGYTRFHPRCGTSFILIVMLCAIMLFAVLDTLLIGWLGELTLPVRIVTHIPFIPVVGGVAYEFIRWSARRSATPLGKALVAPGLWLQRITTKEPDASQLEVAIIALQYALGADPLRLEHPVRVVQRASELAPEHV